MTIVKCHRCGRELKKIGTSSYVTGFPICSVCQHYDGRRLDAESAAEGLKTFCRRLDEWCRQPGHVRAKIEIANMMRGLDWGQKGSGT